MPGLDPATDSLHRYRDQVRLHCYRMTGSLIDSEDLAQEVLVRAWSHRDSFRGEASETTWLYRIATNVCLDFLRGRKRRGLPEGERFPRYATWDEFPAPRPDSDWVEPYPDPQDLVLKREQISLAFVTLLQSVTPLQRAVVLLRDVLDHSAAETAALLDTTPVAVNSALQRARTVLRQPVERPVPDPQAVRGVVERFLEAWETGDVPRLVTLMQVDARLIMPPVPVWIQGAQAIRRVLETCPFGQGDPKRWKLVPGIRANGLPAAGFYERDLQGVYRPFGLQILDIDSEAGRPGIARYYVFRLPSLVGRFGLPEALFPGS